MKRELLWERSSMIPRTADSERLSRGRHLNWVKEPGEIVREHWVTIGAVLAMIVTVLPVVYDSIRLAIRNTLDAAYLAALGDLLLIFIAALLAYGSTVYMLARIGHLKRLRAAGTNPTNDFQLNEECEAETSILALVPSFREDFHVVWRSLASAALQTHVNRVVLLIDDPPEEPASVSLASARDTPAWIMKMIRPMGEDCEGALSRFEQRVQANQFDLATEARQLADLCGRAAAWFKSQAQIYHAIDDADQFFVDLTFGAPVSRWLDAAQRWARLAEERDASLSTVRLRAGYRRLLSVFQVEVTSFERAQFVNLSHAQNKAMNISSYLSLLGGSYRREKLDVGEKISRCTDDDAEWTIPEADFVLILDADTIVSSDYTLKLLRRFREPSGQRLAVVQSPYSTFPRNRSLLQRIAGAQTDIQYLVHQGYTHYNATYWVGANALIRMAALRDIAERAVERGYEIVKFIHDRTLIEDTESTLYLVSKGWRLFNYPERLAFSMTPPDFGSLLVQRGRWANGGLLIVPKLFAYVRQPGKFADRFREGFMRLNYLISLGPVSMALLIALGVSFDNQVRTLFLAGTGLIYYMIYARDLHLIGYRWHEIFHVLALNLVLIPVNIFGMANSVRQAITGRKSRFGRTPKVHGRTPVPARYVLAEFALLAIWCAHFVFSMFRAGTGPAVFMLLHAGILAYAITTFIGFRNCSEDLATVITTGSG